MQRLTQSLSSLRFVFFCVRTTLLLIFSPTSLYLFRSLAVLVLPYLMASSFLLNSCSYLFIPPPCLTMPRQSFCPPTYLFCLLPYLFHCIPLIFYIVSFEYPIFCSLLPPEQIPVLHWTLSFHTSNLDVYILLFFVGAILMMTSPTTNWCCDTHYSPARACITGWFSNNWK